MPVIPAFGTELRQDWGSMPAGAQNKNLPQKDWCSTSDVLQHRNSPVLGMKCRDRK